MSVTYRRSGYVAPYAHHTLIEVWICDSLCTPYSGRDLGLSGSLCTPYFGRGLGLWFPCVHHTPVRVWVCGFPLYTTLQLKSGPLVSCVHHKLVFIKKNNWQYQIINQWTETIMAKRKRTWWQKLADQILSNINKTH